MTSCWCDIRHQQGSRTFYPSLESVVGSQSRSRASVFSHAKKFQPCRGVPRHAYAVSTFAVRIFLPPYLCCPFRISAMRVLCGLVFTLYLYPYFCHRHSVSVSVFWGQLRTSYLHSVSVSVFWVQLRIRYSVSAFRIRIRILGPTQTVVYETYSTNSIHGSCGRACSPCISNLGTHKHRERCCEHIGDGLSEEIMPQYVDIRVKSLHAWWGKSVMAS